MFKKIATIATLAASASFATYTFFPVGENHTGEVVLTGSYNWGEVEKIDNSQMLMSLGGEFVVIPGIELSLYNIDYQFWNEAKDCDDDIEGCPNNDGIKAMTFGARYQVIPVVSVALDLGLPLSSDDVTDGYDPFSVYVAGQFSMEFVQNLYFGSELGFLWTFEDENVTRGKILTVQAELDYAISSIGLTPWIGFEFDQQLTDSEFDMGKDGSGDNQILIWVGAQYDITKMFYVKGNYMVARGDIDGDYMNVNGSFGVRF